MFGIYIIVMTYLLFFSESYGRSYHADSLYRYNLVPLLEIRRFWEYREQLGFGAFLTNILGNVLCFFPYGFIIPIVLEKTYNGFMIILSGFGVSLCVETIQLITKVGCFDVDDIILNTIGVVIGYFSFVICNYLRRKYYGKKI